MNMLKKIELYLNKEFEIVDFDDSSNNGIQVENSGEVRKVCCGVDGSMELFEQAAEMGANMVVCHHGISWGDCLKKITKINYKKISFLIRNDIALYACHLPLDAHAKHGNNILICRALGLKSVKKFGWYKGVQIGYEGVLPKPMAFDSFKQLVGRTINSELRTMDFGKKTVRRVAVVSGGAAEEISEAGQKGVDVYLSGEPKLSAYSMAQELGINAVFAGHYATEVFGVRAIGDLLQKKFGVKAEFIDLKIPY